MVGAEFFFWDNLKKKNFYVFFRFVFGRFLRGEKFRKCLQMHTLVVQNQILGKIIVN